MIFPDSIPVYGDKNLRGKCPTEDMEMVTFFNQLRAQHPAIGAVAVHIKNEGKKRRDKVARDKIEGMVTGASDIIIPGCPSFVCEMKRRDHTQSTITDEQIQYLLAAQNMGAFVCIALGYEGAFLALQDWINGI